MDKYEKSNFLNRISKKILGKQSNENLTCFFYRHWFKKLNEIPVGPIGPHGFISFNQNNIHLAYTVTDFLKDKNFQIHNRNNII